jgi:hypothetical protein
MANGQCKGYNISKLPFFKDYMLSAIKGTGPTPVHGNTVRLKMQDDDKDECLRFAVSQRFCHFHPLAVFANILRLQKIHLKN